MNCVEKIVTLMSITGNNAKQDFIKENSNDEEFTTFLYYALNPMITYNLSEKTLRNDVVDTKTNLSFVDIFDCCEYLSKQRGIDNNTINDVKVFLNSFYNEEKEIFIQLLAKTLRLGVTAKTVNKIIPKLIPEWEVQQAFPIDKYPLKENVEFWLTQKLNGVRATLYEGKLLARSGVPYTGLSHILDVLKWADEENIILDGELTLIDKGNLSDNEAFRKSTGILNSDATNKNEILYTIFDAIPKNDFDSDRPSIKYSERRMLLDKINERLNNCNCVKVLPILYHGTEQSNIDILLEQMVREDKEGLMLNMNVPYKRTRHNGILKVKRFYTMDLPIKNVEEGTGRLVGTLGALVLDYKGNEVKCGSGFSDEQRKTFWENRDNLIDVLCEVKYKEISSDKKTGLESLQFPVFVTLRTDKNDVSYA